MSRPPTKRRRFFGKPSDEGELYDAFASSSTAHIFAAASSSRSVSSSDVLHPRSYEITLNHDVDLKRSLHSSPSSISVENDRVYGSRTVTWTSSCGTQSVTTDHYDAVHLLRQLPPKTPQSHPRQRLDPAEDLGWSDLDSDTEDLFYMTDVEAADFAHSKARAALEAQRTTRLARLPSPSPPADDMIDNRLNVVGVEERSNLSRTQFDLMQKTAKIISSSDHPAQLELKILANHGTDERFAFLRNGEHRVLWEALKANKGEMIYEAASAMLDDTKVQKVGGAGLVAYDDSDTDSNSDPDPPPYTAQPTVDESKEPDEAAQKKQKQAERLTRAKIWLQSRSSQCSAQP